MLALVPSEGEFKLIDGSRLTNFGGGVGQAVEHGAFTTRWLADEAYQWVAGHD